MREETRTAHKGCAAHNGCATCICTNPAETINANDDGHGGQSRAVHNIDSTRRRPCRGVSDKGTLVLQ